MRFFFFSFSFFSQPSFSPPSISDFLIEYNRVWVIFLKAREPLFASSRARPQALLARLVDLCDLLRACLSRLPDLHAIKEEPTNNKDRVRLHRTYLYQ